VFPVLLVAFLVVPIAELYVFDITVLAIVAVSVIGAWLVKREGISTWRRAQERLSQGEAPTDELINGLLILVAGAFMLTPGFLTDALGLTLLFPPTRLIYRRAVAGRLLAGPIVASRMGQSAYGRYRTGRGASDATDRTDAVWDVEGWEDPPDRPSLP
jgi:UPF0716 protein FxsA